MNKVEAIKKLNERELQLGIAGTTASWHEKYARSNVVYVGGLSTVLTEGDLLSVFEQYGTIVHVNLVREIETGKSRGFAFLKYHDARSAVLAVDNFNGSVILDRTIRVDHVDDYKSTDEEGKGGLDTVPAELQDAAKHSISGNEERQCHFGANSLEAAKLAERESRILQRLREMRGEIETVEHGSGGQKSHRKDNGHGKRKYAQRGDRISDEGPIPDSAGSQLMKSRSFDTVERERRHREKAARKAQREEIRERRRQKRAKREGGS